MAKMHEGIRTISLYSLNREYSRWSVDLRPQPALEEFGKYSLRRRQPATTTLVLQKNYGDGEAQKHAALLKVAKNETIEIRSGCKPVIETEP